MPAPFQVCVPGTLQAEYVQKSLKGRIFIRLQSSFCTCPARLLLNVSPAAVSGQIPQASGAGIYHIFPIFSHVPCIPEISRYM